MSYYYDAKSIEVKYGDVRKARKEDWYPSLTTVLKMAYSEGLEIWKSDQIIEACIQRPFKFIEQMDELRTLVYVPEHDAHEYKKIIKKMADEISSTARDTGTAVHSAIEVYLKQGYRVTDIENEKTRLMFESVKEWIDTNIKEIIASETAYVDNELKIGCRVDLIAVNKDGDIIIVDFKTQGVKDKPKFYNTMIAQLVGQERASQLKIDKHINVIISSIADEEGKYNIYVKEWSKEEYENGLEYLKAVRTLYKIEKRI